MRLTFIIKISLAAITLLGLSGCSDDGNKDLTQWIDQVKSKPATGIEPLPEIRPYEAFIYSAAHLRSPFTSARPEAIGELGSLESCDSDVRPDPNRVREELEDFALQSLQMVGSLSQGSTHWALIKQDSGSIHRIQVGNHLGLNHGQIVNISEQNIQLMETVPNGQGCWEARPMTLEVQL
ncbi:MAG: pilus assembly protein PilP [Gammaproteobacteria bacterium]|nr:MAG: pilus assembly protein PilP [Gammaproteobacteria bacterium]